MKRRYLFTLAASLLFLAACSSDNNLVSQPNLEPQFGTMDDDVGLDVAAKASDHAYVLSSQFGYLENGDLFKALLRRYDGAGRLSWVVEVASVEADYVESEEWLHTRTVAEDNQGNAYAFVSRGSFSYTDGYSPRYLSYFVRKYSPAGEHLKDFYLGTEIYGFNGGSITGLAVFTVNGAGSVYATLTDCEAGSDGDGVVAGDCDQYVKRYNATGRLLWQRLTAVGTPVGIAVTSAGNVYVVGSQGMARYSSSGDLVWTKTGTSYRGSDRSTLVTSGSNLYLSVPKTGTVRKYDANGRLLWSRVQSGLNTLVIGDISSDTNGNVYISGKYRPTSSSPANVFVRKLRPTGSALWTKTFGTLQYDDGRGIATINGSEIYVTGETQGSLAHPNRGGLGNRDGYLHKLNRLGNPV